MKKQLVAAGVATSLCLGIIGTSFAQSVGKLDLSKNDPRLVRDIPVLEQPKIPEIDVPIEADPKVRIPQGEVMNWAAIAAVAAAVYAVTEVAHHAKESWFPGGIDTPIDVINPATEGIFDVPQLDAAKTVVARF